MRTHRIAGLLAVTGAASVPLAPAASAQLDQPSPPPYIPGNVDPQPGSFSFPYNVILVGPPAAFDARGVNATATVDPAQSAFGMPGDALGNSPPPPNSLTGSNALYGISAGGVDAPPPPGTVNIAAGHPAATGLEDPSGKPPSNAAGPESAASTAAPSIPLPALEDPHANRSSD
ncbi:hypothetical protein JRC04_28025 [Mycolicibacterium sp. S2-37]|uniref:hypothetical protein n=1 Tax=Mycolicibacterium sp. S2-37 TaxID=2810297 RepID=UPI001A94EE0C|nr:hypothetical protein [Mycolicibacterium sp. S2-37]MBO0681328.1 hypothetical protein [Mycolicibacterium sp. S2-37]